MFTGFSYLFDNELDVFSFIALISAISVIISSAEWLSLQKHFKDNGIFSWQTRKSRARYLLNGKFKHLFDFIFSFPNVVFVNGINLIASISIVFIWRDIEVLKIICFIIALTLILLSFRGFGGFNGSDQMSKITFTALFICLFSPNPIVWKVGLFFLTGQLIIAYSTSGWLRITQPTWRNGSDLKLVIRQHTYGNKFIWKLTLRHPTILKTSSMAILIFEISILFAIFLPYPYFCAYLCIGVLFHLINAIIMGLNSFFWSFVGVYPAAMWTCIQINKYLYQL